MFGCAVKNEPVAEFRDSLETAVLANADTTSEVVNEPPNEVDVPIIVIAEFANLPFAIEPANCELVIVPLRLEVWYPVASAKLNAGVESDEPKATLTPPNDTELLSSFAFVTESSTNWEPFIVLFVKVCVAVANTTSSSLPFGPAVHLSSPVFQINEPVVVVEASASLT